MRTNENALWSLGVHDLSVILYLLDEEPGARHGTGQRVPTPGVEDVVFCYLRFPSGKIAHMHLSWLDPHKMRKMTVVGREKMVVFDDMELERKVTVYEKSAVEARRDVRRVADALRRHLIPKISTAEPLRLECRTSSSWSTGKHDRGRSRATARASCARSRC